MEQSSVQGELCVCMQMPRDSNRVNEEPKTIESCVQYVLLFGFSSWYEKDRERDRREEEQRRSVYKMMDWILFRAEFCLRRSSPNVRPSRSSPNRR